MGFMDNNGIPLINDEQKVRINLSQRALVTLSEDMKIFGVSRAATFINIIFKNFKTTAKASISLYLQQRDMELQRLFQQVTLSDKSRQVVIQQLLDVEKEKLIHQKEDFLAMKGSSKLYHINDENIEYLIEECTEDEYYDRPGQYIRALFEEYCTLPFIQREAIFQKEVYEMVERACKDRRILKVKAMDNNRSQLFYVYPYKIVPDPLHLQSYLICYSRKAEEEERDKIIASFSMARLQPPTIFRKQFHLNKEEIATIEQALTRHSPAYFLGIPEYIQVKLTQQGKKMYRTCLSSRPIKVESASTDDIYVFDCSQQQAFNYFFSFGKDAEILSPPALRERFKITYEQALSRYR